MKINSCLYRTTITITAISVISYFGYDCYQDNKKANTIKQHLREHPLRQIHPYAPEFAVSESESQEPFFNKTDYWELEYLKIKKELDEKQQKYIQLKDIAKKSSTYHINE